jgi:hypothetical protein
MMGGASAVTDAVTAGLVPAVHVFAEISKKVVEARAVRREDGASRLLPAHDEWKASDLARLIHDAQRFSISRAA